MKSTRISVGGLALALAASSVWGYLPPVDKLDGVTVSIKDFPDKSSPSGPDLRKVDVAKPLDFTVTVENKGNSRAAGGLDVWLNDDWSVKPSRAEIDLAPGNATNISFTAQAGEKVLDALYPVHAKLSLDAGDIHPIAVFETTGGKRAFQPKSLPDSGTLAKGGYLRLETISRETWAQTNGKTPVSLGKNNDRSDPATGAVWQRNYRTDEHSGFSMHPAWKQGWGDVWSDFKITLADGVKPRLHFEAVVPNSQSDGVEFRALVSGKDGQWREFFREFHAGHDWKPFDAALPDGLAGEITLRLWAGPGPKHSTNCDSAMIGSPVLSDGALPEETTVAETNARDEEAVRLALRAAEKKAPENSLTFLLKNGKENFGAAIVPGRNGLMDSSIAFATDGRAMVWHGFLVGVDYARIGGGNGTVPVREFRVERKRGKIVFLHNVDLPEGSATLAAELWKEKGALRVAWSMPGTKRDPVSDKPHYTELAFADATMPAWRAYAGFGNVMEDPREFAMGTSGFNLSTRHIGADYTNGLSLVQASDVFPDKLVCSKKGNTFSLFAHNDATLSFVPSAKGAFAAARAFRDIAGYKPAKGIKGILGTMCLDQWGGDYKKAAEDLREAKRHGIDEAVFVKHVWQRWGYDYRLPEIYPAERDNDAFIAIAKACEETGIIFAPHDNYIDFYPDAAGFSYNRILFNSDGTPQKAWYNKGRGAQSYRFLPGGYWEDLERNMTLLRDNVGNKGLFIDVFTAHPPTDVYDRNGKFYPKPYTTQQWGDAFVRCREILGGNGPMISEAGEDHLIGKLDAGEADHFPASRLVGTNNFANAERVPWHDMASHGSFILFAGGLGPRYADISWNQPGNNLLHGYNSDDYLSNTVIGGRNPMSNGPFNRGATKTYWLLHDVCSALARESFEEHSFGDTIQQQHTLFGKGSEVWTNRGEKDQELPDGTILPKYGFLAKTKNSRAGIVRLDGVRAAFAESAEVFFADARPLYGPGSSASVKVLDGTSADGVSFRVETEWKVSSLPATNFFPFVHLLPKGDNAIAFHGAMQFDRKALLGNAPFKASIVFTFPEKFRNGEWQIYAGMWDPVTHQRMTLFEGDGEHRIDAGRVSFTGVKGLYSLPKDTGVSEREELNVSRKTLDFGPVKTDGAFRLLHPNASWYGFGLLGRPEWTIVIPPGSNPFRAELAMEALGARGAKVASIDVEARRPGDALFAPTWRQEGDKLFVESDGKAFAYRIRFE